MFYLDLFRRLMERRVRYLVAGGVAVNLHGVPRMTADLDLAVALDEVNLTAALSVLEDLGFVPSLPVSARELLLPDVRADWIVAKHMIAFPFHNPRKPYESVDFLIHLPVDFATLWTGRSEVDVEGTLVPVLGLDDLISLKQATGRPQDQADADALTRLRHRNQERSRER